MRTNANVDALNAQRNVNVAVQMYAMSIQKLSSGLQINRAADDAAGLSISGKLRSQVLVVSQAIRNSQDGISKIQTAEGVLNEAHDIVHILPMPKAERIQMGSLEINAPVEDVGTSSRPATSRTAAAETSSSTCRTYWSGTRSRQRHRRETSPTSSPPWISSKPPRSEC